jgi:hypothetical protein
MKSKSASLKFLWFIILQTIFNVNYYVFFILNKAASFPLQRSNICGMMTLSSFSFCLLSCFSDQTRVWIGNWIYSNFINNNCKEFQNCD